VYANFQDGHRRHFVNSSERYKMGNCRQILMKFGTQTKIDMLSLKFTKAELYGEKTPKIKCKKRYRFKKATLYKCEVIKKNIFGSLAEASILIQQEVRQS
jgi:hypothetical protein